MIGYNTKNVSLQCAVSFFKVVKGELENSSRQKTASKRWLQIANEHSFTSQKTAVTIDNTLKTSTASKFIAFSLHHTSLHSLSVVQRWLPQEALMARESTGAGWEYTQCEPSTAIIQTICEPSICGPRILNSHKRIFLANVVNITFSYYLILNVFEGCLYNKDQQDALFSLNLFQ
jgi:hypothetical protein